LVYDYGLRLAARSGLVVQVSGGTLTRNKAASTRQSTPNLNLRENRVDTIFRAGLDALLFFSQIALRLEIMPSANPIERSLELAAIRCEDLTPLVYARLHRDYPETRTMFRTEGSEPVKGSMLALTLEAILDLAGERSGKFRMIECEISSHDAYGTPRELFIAFFGVIAATLRELLGAEWSEEIDTAWRDLQAEIEIIVAESQT